MRVGIVGGRLQGLEAAYLSREAGFETVLFDKDEGAPARSMTDEFHCLDLLRPEVLDTRLFDGLDLLIPAAESYEVLLCLRALTASGTIPVALDLASYAITSSKIRSNELLDQAGVRFPPLWPECGLPAIVKPAGGSGSQGVHRVLDTAALEAAVNAAPGAVVVQGFAEGPSYSLEVIAHRGECCCFQVTELEVDATFDCKRVIAGPNTGRSVAAAFSDIGREISRQLGLSGIMDIEVINDGGQLSVLEIDARLPSQTPAVVYHSTGLNMVALLAEYWIGGTLPFSSWTPTVERGVVYEHYRCRSGVLEVCGEHVLSDASDLRCYSNHFAAERLIANFDADSESWVATAIYVGEDEDQAWVARERGVREMMGTFGGRAFLDPSPAPLEGEPIDPTHR